jgi:hypothetical protein
LLELLMDTIYIAAKYLVIIFGLVKLCETVSSVWNDCRKGGAAYMISKTK